MKRGEDFKDGDGGVRDSTNQNSPGQISGRIPIS
jgi:hypothetical protein